MVAAQGNLSVNSRARIAGPIESKLYIDYALRRREMSVSELVATIGLGQANVSKHLQVLHALGFVKRRKNGLFVHYALVDRNGMKLCELMSGRLETQLESHRQLLES